MIKRSLSPTSKLFLAALLALLGAGLVLWLSTAIPWYGLDFERVYTTDNQSVQLKRIHPPIVAHDYDFPAPVTAINGITVINTDIIEEPDVFTDYPSLHQFYDKQQQLYQSMQSGQLLLTFAEQPPMLIAASSPRPLKTFPTSFWVQIITGVGGFIIGSWVVALRPKDGAAHCFMLTGLGLMSASFAAAIYSTRELAISATLFKTLTFFNDAGSILFGFALAGLFLYFPKQILKSRWINLFLSLFLVWLVIEIKQLAPSPQEAVYPLVLLLSCIITGLIALQWWKNRGDPQAMAALRWLGLATLITTAVFLVLVALPVLFSSAPIISQGNAFGFFLVLYAGLALGLRRTRLFELDQWAYHILLWVLAGLMLIGLDLIFFSLLHWQQHTSLLAALLLCGFLYLPLRGWLWRWLIAPSSIDSRRLFNQVVEVALAPTSQAYQERWQSLLAELFNPAQITSIEHNTNSQLSIGDNGLFLLVPSNLHASALMLSLADKGKRLFTPHDLRLATEVLDMLDYANENRHAWQQGAQQERLRIAQDLHDDLGSRLLTGLHQAKLEQVHDTVSLAIADMRTIVRGLAGQAMPLAQIFAELREESMQRCESANIILHWPVNLDLPQIDLDYQTYRHLLSVVRELFSNIIRHAQANQIELLLSTDQQKIQLQIDDNGIPYDGMGNSGGQGMENLFKRVNLLGGSINYQPHKLGTTATLTIPIHKPSS